MQVIRDGEYYNGAYISGPSHVFLGLKFSPTGTPLDIILEAKEIGSDDGVLQLIDPQQLRDTVVDGVNAVNAELRVERIQYVPTDTRRMNLYLMLASAIAEEATRDM